MLVNEPGVNFFTLKESPLPCTHTTKFFPGQCTQICIGSTLFGQRSSNNRTCRVSRLHVQPANLVTTVYPSVMQISATIAPFPSRGEDDEVVNASFSRVLPPLLWAPKERDLRYGIKGGRNKFPTCSRITLFFTDIWRHGYMGGGIIFTERGPVCRVDKNFVIMLIPLWINDNVCNRVRRVFPFVMLTTDELHVRVHIFL